MSYQKERGFFLQMFGREFPQAGDNVATRLLREASTQQRISEIECSIDVGEKELTRLERRAEASCKRVREMVTGEVEFGGDPRGFPFVLKCPSGSTYDFGGRGLGVPGRGLPVSAFN